MELLTRAAAAFVAASRSSKRVFDALVEEVAASLECIAVLTLLTPDGEHFRACHVAALTPQAQARARLHYGDGEHRLETHPAIRHAIVTLTPFHRRTLEAREVEQNASPEVIRLVSEMNVGSVIAVPVVLRGHVLGALVLVRAADARPGGFDDEDVAFARALSEHAALALGTAQALEASDRELAERRRMADRLRVLADASHDFAEATGDYDRLLESVARRLAETIGDLAAVRPLNADGTRLEAGAAYHADAEIRRWANELAVLGQEVGEGWMGRVAATGEAVLIPRITAEDYAAQTSTSYRQFLERLQVGSALAAPMRCRNRVIGVITLLRSGAGRPYTDDDLNLVRSLADHASLAVTNARSFTAERAAREAQSTANDALHESELAHRLLFDASPMPLFVFDVTTLGFVAVNEAALKLYGYDHDEMMSATVLDIGVQQDETYVRQRLGTLGDREVSGTVQHRRKDGRVLVLEYKSRALSVSGRRARIAVLRDVTSHAEADETRALLAAIVESSNDAIVSKRLDGTITSWNRAAERLFGHPAVAAVGRSITMIVPDELLDEERTLLAKVSQGERIDHFETTRVRADGRRVQVSLSLAPILDALGTVVGASKTARDLTAQRDAEEALRRTEGQLRHAQKMEAVGRLAGGIAHDFNNVLSVVLSYSEMILSDLPDEDPTRSDVEEIRTAARRAADLTRQLLMFSRQQVVAPKVLDLNEVLTSMDKMLRRILGEDVELVSVRSIPIGLVRADRGSVEQVIMNLAVNARDAMPMGGKLTIETAMVDLDDEYVRTHAGTVVGRHVMLAVTDTGAGMDAATQARIFEPFFTTKDPGRGTGLGLSTVFGIAQQFGGSVWVYSEVGGGTTFKVYFPQVDGAVEVGMPTSSIVRKGTETVLLVEDQPQVRAVAEGILQRSGYVVLSAQNADDALLIADRHPGVIDVLVTDVVMPQISGAQLAKLIAARRPNIKILCMSGYTDDSIVRHGVIESGLAFLQKPFTPESLTRKLREVIEAQPSRFFS